MYHTVLVTGGAGFIGSAFIRYILQKYGDSIRVINLDKLTYAGSLKDLECLWEDPRYTFVCGDVCSPETVENVCKKYQPDAVIHFAAETHVDRSIQDPNVFVRTNVMGTVNMLNACKALWMDASGNWQKNVRYVQVSTDEVYGSLGAEGFFTEESPLAPRSPYSASKASADLFCKAYYDTYKMPCIITRCSNNYGPRQFPEKFIPRMIRNMLRKEELPVYGDGLQIRDWIHVYDHCEALDLVLKKGKPGQVYAIGGGNEHTNLEIIQKLLKILSDKTSSAITEELIHHVEDRKGHDRRYALCSRKIREELGWESKIPFEEGLSETVDWYLQNPDWLELDDRLSC